MAGARRLSLAGVTLAVAALARGVAAPAHHVRPTPPSKPIADILALGLPTPDCLSW